MKIAAKFRAAFVGFIGASLRATRWTRLGGTPR